jgi:hypothetical protein
VDARTDDEVTTTPGDRHTYRGDSSRGRPFSLPRSGRKRPSTRRKASRPPDPRTTSELTSYARPDDSIDPTPSIGTYSHKHTQSTDWLSVVRPSVYVTRPPVVSSRVPALEHLSSGPRFPPRAEPYRGRSVRGPCGRAPVAPSARGCWWGWPGRECARASRGRFMAAGRSGVARRGCYRPPCARPRRGSAA